MVVTTSRGECLVLARSGHIAVGELRSASDPKRTTALAHVGQTRDCRFDQLISARDGGTFATSGVPSMCDYSLHLIASRPARVGDKLISTSFPHTMNSGLCLCR